MRLCLCGFVFVDVCEWYHAHNRSWVVRPLRRWQGWCNGGAQAWDTATGTGESVRDNCVCMLVPALCLCGVLLCFMNTC